MGMRRGIFAGRRQKASAGILAELSRTAGVVALLTVASQVTYGQDRPGVGATPPTTVASVDVDRYVGTWYELARYPNKFQRQCVRDVTATYERRQDGRLTVINRCETDKGTEQADGVARIVDRASNAKLEVRFAPAILSFLPMVWGDYWILDIGGDYDTAVVGTPDRKYLWVLSRTPRVDGPTWARITETVRREGFDPERLVETPQR